MYDNNFAARSNARTGEVVGNGETNASGTCVVDKGLLLILSRMLGIIRIMHSKSVDLSLSTKIIVRKQDIFLRRRGYTAAAEFVPEKENFIGFMRMPIIRMA